MPKQKTNRAAAKRFKISGTGKAIRARSGIRHGMIGKSRNRKRQLVGTVMVSEPDQPRVLRMLGKR
ncbi:MAG TPA: 50S ribosomal protein L35 [Candidatus Saccharimonadaceae bacterium]|jgi:large subunit ribosomal protein L35|nr:50S ribosomal protein L35 [Candidatus Saccharimonadaceae bacterium]